MPDNKKRMAARSALWNSMMEMGYQSMLDFVRRRHPGKAPEPYLRALAERNAKSHHQANIILARRLQEVIRRERQSTGS